MNTVGWIVIATIVLVVGGIFFGIAGLLIAPLLGIFAIIAIAALLLKRRSEGKPPIK